MKKKIKDITFFDVNEVCLKHSDCNKCPLALPHDKCPLYILVGGDGSRCIIGLLNSSLPEEWIEILEQEVEI